MYFSIHNHSEYSNIKLLDSINKIPMLFDRAIEIGLKGFALTDHEVLSGHVQMIKTYQKYLKEEKIDENFKIVLGDEIYLIDDIEDYQENYSAATHSYYHFILLAKNFDGHLALKEISSTAWVNSYTQRGVMRTPITKKQLKDIISRYPNTLIGSTACLGGELPKLIMQLEKAEREYNDQAIYQIKTKIDRFITDAIDLFGIDNFFLEIQPSHNKEQILVNKMLLKLSSVYNVKVIYSTDSHYPSKEKRIIHKSYLNAMDGEREVDDFYATAYMMDIEEIYSYMSDYLTLEEFNILTENSIYLMDKCEIYDLAKPQLIPNVEVKNYNKNSELFINTEYEYLQLMATSDYIDDRYWINECLLSLKAKGLKDKKYIDRLNEEAKELWLISEKLNIRMTQYYNTMKKIIEIVWYEGDSLVGTARGSATGFLSCYLLGITQLDPLEWNLPHWRHLTATRPELPDIDFDTQASRRSRIIHAIQEFFNKDIPEIYAQFESCYNVLNIATFGTDASKSACITACRGYRSEEFPEGIDSDIAQYLTSMIPSERGFTWTLHDCIYGNEEKDRKPISLFVKEINKYENLLEIMMSIEGLVNKRSIHASGVYIYNDGFLKYNAVMRAPSGQFITQFNMDDSDYMGSLKYDFLTIEALDKIRTAIDLLSDDGLIEWRNSLKETYDKYLHPDVLSHEQAIWDLMGNGEVINLFQFDTPVGSQCAKKIKPKSLFDAASANSLMRLMADHGSEQPMDRYIRLKTNMQLWYFEMKQKGLNENEVKILEPHYLPVYGTPNTQEDLMEILMNPKITNADLTYANKARKIIAKKKMDEVEGFKATFFEKGLENNCRQIFLEYIWDTTIKPQLGYSFSRNHTVPYSFIALQELNLYHRFPSIYWNTACLTVNAGSMDMDEDDAQKSTNYAKMAIAIGDIQKQGLSISLADINRSSFSFKPDAVKNEIIFGLKGVTNVGDDLITEIIKNRPYTSIEDFLNKIKINKRAMLNLIKGGSFDYLYEDRTREDILKEYITITSEPKKKLTLQNFNGLIEAGLVPDELEFIVRVFNYNKVLKKYFKKDDYFVLENESVLLFYQENFDQSLLEVIDNIYHINQKIFDKQIYQKQMDKARAWLKKNHDEVLTTYNNLLFQEEWDKYCKGNISSWEMESISFYYHEHELAHVNKAKYGISDFDKLPYIPEIDYFFKKNGQDIPIYKLTRIVGTVIGKNKTNGTIHLLTVDGVVTVKFRKEMFAIYDKQLSEKQEDGTKKITEKSWFTKGNKVMITGYRREDQFVPKKYAKTQGHTLYIIDKVHDNGDIDLRSER